MSTAAPSLTTNRGSGCPALSQSHTLTTYRRDGRPVTTPVWAVPLEGKLYVVTANSTRKARRVRATAGFASPRAMSVGRHVQASIAAAFLRNAAAVSSMSKPHKR